MKKNFNNNNKSDKKDGFFSFDDFMKKKRNQDKKDFSSNKNENKSKFDKKSHSDNKNEFKQKKDFGDSKFGREKSEKKFGNKHDRFDKKQHFESEEKVCRNDRRKNHDDFRDKHFESDERKGRHFDDKKSRGYSRDDFNKKSNGRHTRSRQTFDKQEHFDDFGEQKSFVPVELTEAQIKQINDNSPIQYVAICQVGLENVLADEIRALGAEVVSVQRSTVFFICDKITMYKANMALRSAVSILKPLKKIITHDYDNLYHQACKINWHKMFTLDKNIRIDIKGTSHQLPHSQYVTHRVRDAIMDTFRKFNDGARPSVDKDEPDIHVIVYLSESDVTFYLDSSGVPLFKRGYREDEHFIAPMKEELAAGLIELSGWTRDCDVLDICCGSGTLLIEAALMATNTAPNLNRNFAFQNWFDYNEAFYEQAHRELEDQITTSQIKLVGYEVDKFVAKKAQNIVRSLGLDDMITIINRDFRNAEQDYENNLVISNPPYGQRLESDDEEKVFALYKDIGDFLKQKCKGSTAFIFTGNFEAMKHIGLRANRHEVYNGPIECRLLEIKCF